MNDLFLFMLSMNLRSAMFIFLPLAFILFYLSKYILRRLLKKQPTSKITLWALISSCIATPLFIALVMFLFIGAKTPSDRESEQRYYRRLDKEIAVSELLGKTKEEIVETFGETDTTQATLIYDFTLPEADYTYKLVVNFEENQVVSYHTRKE